MSILSAVRTYIAGYSQLKSGAPLWVDYLGPKPTEYSIMSVPGNKVIERWLNGGSLREFPFALQVTVSTADDAERLNSAEFFEAFSDWLDAQTEAGAFPTLGAKQEAIRIEAVGWGYLLEQGSSGTGIYQITCKLTYAQEP